MSNRIRFGVQTNAWAIDPARIHTLYSVLDRVHDLGFDGFETSFRNFQSVSDDLPSVRAHIETKGLRFFGIHIFLQEYNERTYIPGEEICAEIAQAGSTLKAEHLIVSGAPCLSETDLVKKAAGLNRAGAVVAMKNSLSFAYHNHTPEFQNRGREIRYLIENTDPKLVSFVIDAGHAFRAGADVPSFLSMYARRVVGVHLRDWKDGREVPLGAGTFPLEATLSALRSVDWSGWALLEEERGDGSKPGDRAIVQALNALHRG